MVQLDQTNLRLLELLQEDARSSITELARLVNRSESTVRDRISALENAGILRGYRAVVDLPKMGYQTRAMLRADCDMRRLPELAKQLSAIPQVRSVCVTTGPKPLRIEVCCENVAQLERLVEHRMAPLDLHGLETAIVVKEIVPRRPLAVNTFLALPARRSGPDAGQPAPVVRVTVPPPGMEGADGT